MIKAFCDLCEEEIKDKDFMCDMNIVKTVINLTNNTKQPSKKNLLICKKCYDDKLKATIKV